MRHDVLSDVLSCIKNGDHVGKKEVIVASSSLAKDVLIILQKNAYIGNFEFIDDGRGGKFKVALTGNINNCGTIRPRYSVRLQDYNKYKRRLLPASGFGMLIVSTSKGVMTHNESEELKIGGKLLAFIY